MTHRDDAFTAYLNDRLPWLRRVAFLLCQDWQRSEDLVQSAATSLYVHWNRVAAMEHLDAYTRTILLRQYLNERRSGWSRLETPRGELPDGPGGAADPDLALDLRQAVAGLPPRQRAVLVLRFYCDLTVEQAARELRCSEGTVKSQTAKAVAGLRRVLDPATAPGPGQEEGEWR